MILPGNSKAMEKYLTTAEAAAKLRVSASRIRQLICENRLASLKHGRDHFISELEVERFAKEGRRKPGRPKNNTCASVRN